MRILAGCGKTLDLGPEFFRRLLVEGRIRIDAAAMAWHRGFRTGELRAAPKSASREGE
jgi:hypothetical protein